MFKSFGIPQWDPVLYNYIFFLYHLCLSNSKNILPEKDLIKAFQIKEHTVEGESQIINISF